MSLLGKLFARGVDDGEDVVLRPGRQLTRQDIGQIAERAATEFRNRSMNLMSCFGPLEGEFGLYSTLSNFVRTKNPLSAEISEAVQDGDEVALLQILIQAMEVAFVMLYVERLQIRRKTLIEPDIGPVAPLHIVAEPMLAQLMGNDVRAGIILVGALIVQCPVGQGGRAHILLSPEDEVAHRGLRVLLVGVIEAAGARKKTDHVGRQTEGSPGRGLIYVIRNVIVNRFAFILVAELVPRSYG